MTSPTHTLSPEWQNENELRAYPLQDDAPAGAVLPAWFLSDLRVTCGSPDGVVFISSAYLSDTLVSVAVSVAETLPPETPGGEPRTVVSGLLARTVTRDELEPRRAYSMDRLSEAGSGMVAFGEIPPDAAPFRLTFGPGDAPLAESAVVRTAGPGVKSVADRARGTAVSGIVDLSGNSEFRTYEDPEAPNTIVVELSDAYREMTTSACSATPSFDACGATPVRTINGVAPDGTGAIELRFR